MFKVANCTHSALQREKRDDITTAAAQPFFKLHRNVRKFAYFVNWNDCGYTHRETSWKHYSNGDGKSYDGIK